LTDLIGFQSLVLLLRFFYRSRVCAVIPTCRISSATGTHTSAYFDTATISSTEKRFLFTATSPPLLGVDFAGNQPKRVLEIEGPTQQPAA
jgi:hypothetical protein